MNEEDILAAHALKSLSETKVDSPTLMDSKKTVPNPYKSPKKRAVVTPEKPLLNVQKTSLSYEPVCNPYKHAKTEPLLSSEKKLPTTKARNPIVCHDAMLCHLNNCFTAKLKQNCQICLQKIYAGDCIVKNGSFGWTHTTCPTTEDSPPTGIAENKTTELELINSFIGEFSTSKDSFNEQNKNDDEFADVEFTDDDLKNIDDSIHQFFTNK